MKPALWHECYHAAGPYTDFCGACAPFWKCWPFCPDCKVRLRKPGYGVRHHRNGSPERMLCPKCRHFVRTDEDKPTVIPHGREEGPGAS